MSTQLGRKEKENTQVSKGEEVNEVTPFDYEEIAFFSFLSSVEILSRLPIVRAIDRFIPPLPFP